MNHTLSIMLQNTNEANARVSSHHCSQDWFSVTLQTSIMKLKGDQVQVLKYVGQLCFTET